MLKLAGPLEHINMLEYISTKNTCMELYMDTNVPTKKKVEMFF